MSIFVDVAKEVEWEDYAEKFSLMVDEKYKNEILTAPLREQKRMMIDWNDLSFDIQDFLMKLEGDQLIMCIEDMEFRLQLDTDTSIRIGFKNYPDLIDLDRCTQNEYTKKLVQVEGMIGSISAPLSYTSKIVWQCQNCERIHNKVYDFYDKATNTNFCPDCKRKTYSTIEVEEKTDFQIIEIVRPVAIVGRTPESLRVILKGDLVEFGDVEDKKLVSGNRIKIVGINKDFPAYKSSVRRKPYLDSMSWFVEKDFMKLSEQDIEEIKEMSKQENLIEDMIDSVAPSLIGMRDIKLSILLQSVGGVSSIREDKTLKRGTIHVLIVGEPSCGKTQLGMWVTKHIPKSRYVVASQTSRAGLGASLRRDEKLGYWYIDAGALLLANNSIAIIDEMDKALGDDLNQLDMVMENEQLTITKVKAGSFPAKTSILALANPKHARFDPYINVSEQIKIQPQTASRFDVKFILKDKIDSARDKSIISSKFIKKIPKMDGELLAKYLYYAKQLKPKIGKKCEKIIIEFYNELRQKSHGYTGSIAITTRQADSIIRLSEAFAKLRLSEDIIKADVENSINLIIAYLKTFGYDMKTGEMDIDLAEQGKPKSKRDLIYRVLDIIKKNLKDGIVSEDIIVSRCEDEDIEDTFVLREAIPQLRKSGDIYSPKFGYWGAVG